MWSRGLTPCVKFSVRPERSAKRAVEGRGHHRPSTTACRPALSTNGWVALGMLALAACQAAPEQSSLPRAGRDVAPIVGESFSTEDARDRLGEAEEVMRLAEIAPGMSVADIGAGEGYYTVRLAPIVGRRGRVLAEDIVPQTRDRLAQRVQREGLDNVAVKLGTPADPMLPPGSFDRIFLVHMYHEVTEPYEFLWNLRGG